MLAFDDSDGRQKVVVVFKRQIDGTEPTVTTEASDNDDFNAPC